MEFKPRDKLAAWYFLAMRKTGRGHGKRHSVNRRRSHHARARAQAMKVLIARSVEQRRALNAEIAAYWRGEREDFPGTL